MGEKKNEKKKEQPESDSNEKRSLRENFFLKRAFYETLMVNKAMVNSKAN